MNLVRESIKVSLKFLLYLGTKHAFKTVPQELVEPCGVERSLRTKDEAGDAVFHSLRHMVPLQLLIPTGHLHGFFHVEGLGVQQEFEVDLPEGGFHNFRLGVQLLHETLQGYGLRLLDKIHLVKHNEVGALNLILGNPVTIL